MVTLNTSLILVLASLFLMSIGYAQRESNWGICVLIVGIICTFSIIGYKLYITFH